MNNLISIIVPIYNAERYLKQLLDSICNQTYSNYELLLINDGSTDNSEQICLDYTENNLKIKYYKQDNSGVSSTRNYGLSLINGKYICFVDADDILSKDYLMDFVKIIEEKKCQLCCCKYEKFSDEKLLNSEEDILPLIENEYENNTKYNLLFEQYGGYLWNKIFLSDIIIKNKIKFKEDIYMTEDMLFVFNYLKYVKKANGINKSNYKYRIINSSASKKLSNRKWFSIFKTFDIILNNQKLYDNQFFSKVLYSYLFYLCEAKYRLNYIDKDNEYKLLKLKINNRLKQSKNMLKKISNKCKFKIYTYKYFNKIAFKLKYRKESHI